MNKLIPAKFGQCDNYCIFIASRHFESLDDFINLEMGVKRFRGNMEKFHYNPIPITKQTAHFFPNVQTQWLHNKNEEKIKRGRIERY